MARDEKRRDTGEFYPGGKVWVKPGQSQPQGRVTWQQIEGKPQIAPLPDRYKDSDVKEKVNEIASKFATVVMAALIGWTACADIAVQKKRKDQIYNDEQVVVDVSGDGVGMKTNTVIDIANATIATNPVVAAKLDGPTVAPTNTADAAGKAADARLTGIDLTNRYTKAEVDAKLEGKMDAINSSHWRFNDGKVEFDENGGGETPAWFAIAEFVDVENGTLRVGTDVYLSGTGDKLSEKANRADSSGTVLTGELATLDEDGNPTRSGISTNDIPKLNADGVIIFGNDGIYLDSTMMIDEKGNRINDVIKSKADVSMISATDPTFSNAVMGVASHTNAAFAAEVLAVQIASLSTNITAEVYIAATNACANLGIDPALIPGAGTTGTVGGFIAILFAVVFWMKRKIFDNGGKVNDTFAGELLGKRVANVKANTASLAAAYSETATYAVGDAVTHDGKLYKCAVEITTAEAWTPAHWIETTVATLWNNADTTSYGGQN